VTSGAAGRLSSGELYLAMEGLEGETLAQRFGRAGLNVEETVVLGLRLAEALGFAHARGVIHRDLKPANVLVRMREQEVTAYLTDFGIARLADSDHNLTAAGVAVGTPSYMAPELHTGSPASQQTDIYSLGCLLWATLVGRAPYAGDTDYQLVQAHLSGPIRYAFSTIRTRSSRSVNSARQPSRSWMPCRNSVSSCIVSPVQRSVVTGPGSGAGPSRGSRPLPRP
jgi:serine/threonine-protein kinase